MLQGSTVVMEWFEEMRLTSCVARFMKINAQSGGKMCAVNTKAWMEK